MSPQLLKDIAELQCLEGWMPTEKGVAMAELITEQIPKVAVEIGVFGGRSLLAIGLALKENGFGVVYGIDPWKLEAALEGENGAANDAWWKNNMNLDDIHRGCMQGIWQRNMDQWCVVIRAKSDHAINLFADKSIDFLHQDSNHSELVSCREVETWHKKMAKKAIWILDDADWSSQSKAIELIQEKGFKIKTDTGKYMVFQRN